MACNTDIGNDIIFWMCSFATSQSLPYLLMKIFVHLVLPSLVNGKQSITRRVLNRGDYQCE